MTDIFDKAFEKLIGHEGGYTNNPKDPGNWTGGLGRGELKGTKYGISAKCLHPDTPVLMRDLTWRRNGDLKVGDELVGFVRDREMRGMRLEPSTVLAISEIALPCVEITTDKRMIVSSREHMWWGTTPKGTARTYKWMMSSDLEVGDEISNYRDPWEVESSPGAQWLAGVFDGEGHLSKNGLSVYQNEGVVADRIRHEFRAMGIEWSEDVRPGGNIRFGVLGSTIQTIGRLRPVRILSQAETFWRGRCTHGRYNAVDRVISVRDVGERPVMAMLTSTGTFIANGLLSHNSYPQLDIKNLSLMQAKDIYRRDFWGALGCHEMAPPLAYMVFDAGVNCGVGRAARWLQGALGVGVDGAIGPKTMAVARDVDKTPGRLVHVAVEFMTLRLFHHLTADWASFGLGWTRRMFKIPFEMMETALWTR